MERKDSITLAVVTFISVLLFGSILVTISKWEIGTEVIHSAPVVKTRIVEVPTSQTKYLYVESPAPQSQAPAVDTYPLSPCPAALQAADEIVNSINLGQDPAPWIAEYQKQRTKCGG